MFNIPPFLSLDIFPAACLLFTIPAFRLFGLLQDPFEAERADSNQKHIVSLFGHYFVLKWLSKWPGYCPRTNAKHYLLDNCSLDFGWNSGVHIVPCVSMCFSSYFCNNRLPEKTPKFPALGGIQRLSAHPTLNSELLENKIHPKRFNFHMQR